MEGGYLDDNFDYTTIDSTNLEDIEEIFEVQGEEYLQCSKCDDLFTSNEDHDIHKSVDHGEEPEDFEESEETYQLTMNPDLTREALREANSLLTETEEKELYGGYDKTGKIQSSVMPYNVPAKATGKYNDNPNEKIPIVVHLHY